jgi:hypothetical protein
MNVEQKILRSEEKIKQNKRLNFCSRTRDKNENTRNGVKNKRNGQRKG